MVWDHLRCYQPARVLQSAREALLEVPSIKDARLVDARSRALSVAAPFLWRSLSLETCLAQSRKTSEDETVQAGFSGSVVLAQLN